MSGKTKIHLLTATVLTFFLCCIDEGYYDLRWMREWDNWFAFVIYVAAFWGFQALISWGSDRLLKEPWKTWFSTFTLSLLGVMFLVYFVFSIR